MPRAHRHYIPQYIWHLTHRCHNRDFLLNEASVRLRWIAWLLEARKREDLSILNYNVTENHIHLLVSDDGPRDTISRSMQLIAGRTAQEYNITKSRRGAFWEDRYHATAVDSHQHLIQCITYIDLNMVRAGVVSHPQDWEHCGYYEMRYPKTRDRIINHTRLMELLGAASITELAEMLDNALNNTPAAGLQRDAKWSDALAVGSKDFLEKFKDQLGLRVQRRAIISTGDNENALCLQEPQFNHYETGRKSKDGEGISAESLSPGEDCIMGDNMVFWDLETAGSSPLST